MKQVTAPLNVAQTEFLQLLGRIKTEEEFASLSRQGRAYPVWKGFQEGRCVFCSRSHFHRVRRFALQCTARPHIPQTAGAQTVRIHGDIAEGERINVGQRG